MRQVGLFTLLYYARGELVFSWSLATMKNMTWLNHQIVSEELYRIRKEKYGWVHYLFQMSLVNSAYSTISSLLASYLSLILMVSVLVYHVYCYLVTVFEAYTIGRFDILVANVHSIILALYVISITSSYVVDKRNIKEIEAQYNERLLVYEYEEEVSLTKFEKFVDYLGRYGLPAGGIGLFLGVYIVAPTMDLRYLEKDCVKNEINFCIPLPMYHPYDTREGWKYVAAYLIQAWFGFYRICVFVAIQMTTAKWVLHLMKELSMFRKSLEIFETRLEKKFFQTHKREIDKTRRYMMFDDKEFNYCAKFCLKESIKHHHNILRYHGKIDDILALPAFLSYSTCMITVGIALVKLMSIQDETTFGANVAYCVVLGAEISSIFILSIIGEYITSVSDDIFDIVSHMPVHNYDLEFRKCLLIFMLGTKRSLSMSSSKFNRCNHEAFGNVLNAAYSFYNVTNASRDK